MSPDVAACVTSALGAEVVGTRPLSGGQIGSVIVATLADGAEVVAKTSDGVPLTGEANMLRYLRDETSLPVPEVLYADDELLILERLEGRPGSCAAAEPHAAELLVALHGHHADRFGFERDTLIGPYRQPNAWADDWPSFFAEYRLVYMAEIAVERGALPPADAERVATVAEALPRLLDHDPAPSLVHGDVWSGNVLCSGNRVTGLLDPAIYFGDAEVELAFIELFGTFGDSFFSAYDGLAGIRDGYRELRRDVYQLYPLLVHVAVFGGGYLPGLRARLNSVEARV